MATNFMSILNLVGAVKVVANDDGTISVPMMTGLNGQPRKWREIAPFLWRETDGKSLLSAEVSLWVLQILSLVVLVGAAAIGAWNAWVVTRGQRRFTAKLWAVLLALSFVVLPWVALVHDLIAFDVNY
jgi:hypothetical protein